MLKSPQDCGGGDVGKQNIVGNCPLFSDFFFHTVFTAYIVHNTIVGYNILFEIYII